MLLYSFAMHPLDGARAKVKRAQKHMIDIDKEARRYAEGQPYELPRIRMPDSQRKVGYRVRITEQPDPIIALMLGDFVHNLRSALDYIIVACVPKQRRKSASFPILTKDIFARDKSGNFMVNDTEGRKSFESAIKGLKSEARALVIALQPYRQGADAHRDILGIINRLENADKHRQLITVGGGIQHLVGRIAIRGVSVLDWHVLTPHKFAKDDTVVGYELPVERTDPTGAIVLASEVDMQFTGTAVIFIKVTRIGGNEPPSDFPLRLTMLQAIRNVRTILRSFEQFVIR